MTIFKNKDVQANINNKSVDLGSIGANFYTEDDNTSSIRININWNGQPVNLNTIDMKPRLDLFLQDKSIFLNEPVDIVLPESGLIQYIIPTKIIKHIGKVDAKLFLESKERSVHVANFNFNILDSGIEGAVEKEISVNLVEDSVRKIVKENAITLLDEDYKEKLDNDLKKYLIENKEDFKGEKGDTGEQGPQGFVGPQGPKGDKGEPGVSDTTSKDEIKNATSNFDNLKAIIDLGLQTDFVKTLKNYSVTTDNIALTIVHAPSKTFHVVQPISKNRALRIWFNKNQNDDYVIMRETEIGDYTLENKSITYQNLQMLDTSMFETAYAPNYFAKTTGATLTGSFIADKINFVSYCNNQGGLWEIILDEGSINEKRTTISVYSDTAVVDKEFPLFDGLEYKKHTIKLVFKGQDPSYPVTTPRGWFNYGGQRPQDVKGTLNIMRLVPVLSNQVQSLYSYSNKDFAIQMRDAAVSSGEQFVPEHNAIGSAFQKEPAKLFGNGEELSFVTDKVYPALKNVSLIQNVIGRVNNVDLANIITNHNIIDGDININGYVEFIKDTYVKSGYAGMIPYFTENVSKIKTSLSNVYTPDLSGAYRVEYLPEKLQAKSYLLSNTKNNVVTAASFSDFLKTMRINENARKGDTWIEHRNAGMGKIYNQQLKDETLKAGAKWQFKLTFRTTEVPYANILI